MNFDQAEYLYLQTTCTNSAEIGSNLL